MMAECALNQLWAVTDGYIRSVVYSSSKLNYDKIKYNKIKKTCVGGKIPEIDGKLVFGCQ